MVKKQSLTETDLAALAARFRKEARKSRAQAAREMGVSQTSIFNAEESPEQSLRMRMIEAYSRFDVIEAVFLVEREERKNNTLISLEMRA
jgi:DNA-binding XRE family transcriptional regulator